MAKAAYCAMCGSNVYLNDDGVCPQGHPAEQLTNHYEVPDLTPAERATRDATAPVERRELNRTVIIALFILAFVVLCGVGACVAGVVAFGTLDDVSTDLASELAEEMPGGEIPAGDEVEPGAGENSSESFDPTAYFGILTTHFFPGFSPVTYYTVGDKAAEPAKYQLLATSDTVPGFQMIFTLLRYAQGSPSGVDQKWIFTGEDGATWQRLPDRGDESPTSLSDFVGAQASVSQTAAEQIMADFAAAHPTFIVSNFESVSGNYVLRGFDESELDDWMGDSTSFESTWEPNPAAPGEWVETSY
ncbi:MAG: hypothetical protein ACYC6C_00500 [Coriobacteriia bacterium]